MLSNKQIICPNNLLDASIKKKGATAAIVNAGKPLPMQSVMDAVKEDLIKPIFIGDKDQIQKCANEIQFDISGYEVIHEPVENNTATFGLLFPILFEKSITFFNICIFVFTFGKTFKAPSVIINGLSSFSNVICQT